jgi:hypothetical protein
MRDDEWIYGTEKSWIVFAEAKTGVRDFNRSWTREDRRVMESFIALASALPRAEWSEAAASLYRDGFYDGNPSFRVSTFLLNDDRIDGSPRGNGERVLEGVIDFAYRWPAAPRMSLQRAVRFIHSRFARFENIKTDHGPVGRLRPSHMGHVQELSAEPRRIRSLGAARDRRKF